MSYENATSMIEGIRQALPSAKENAKNISKVVYETFPNLDELEPNTRLCILKIEDGIAAELTNPYGYFCFNCKNDGSITYCQTNYGDDDRTFIQSYPSYPADKEIKKHIKRKRFPRKPVH